MGKLKFFFFGLAVGIVCFSAVFAFKIVSDRTAAQKLFSDFVKEVDEDVAGWRRAEMLIVSPSDDFSSNFSADLYLNELINFSETVQKSLKLKGLDRCGYYFYREERDRLYDYYRKHEFRFVDVKDAALEAFFASRDLHE